jgi:DinB superfamily
MQADLQRILDQLDAIDRAVDGLCAPLSDEQFFWRPDGGRAWSIAHCLEHLAIANAVYADAMAGGVARARERGLTGSYPIASTIFGRMFIQSMEPPVKRRMRAPTKIVPPMPTNRAEILARFRTAHDRIRQIVRSAADLDVNRATFANPFISMVTMRVGTALRVVTAHDRRHVWQAENVRKRPDFPSGR